MTLISTTTTVSTTALPADSPTVSVTSFAQPSSSRRESPCRLFSSFSRAWLRWSLPRSFSSSSEGLSRKGLWRGGRVA